MKKFLVGITAVLLFVLFGCIFNNPLGKSVITVYLTDKPISDVDKLTVSIKEFTYHYSYEDINGEEIGVWATPTNVATTVDILSLAGTEVSWLKIELPTPSTVTQLRFYIESATVTVNGTDYPVTIPNPEFKIINPSITVVGDGQLILDFDVLRSLKLNNNGVYKLTPVIKPILRISEAYNIYGLVTENSTPVSKALVALFDTSESTVLRTTFTDSDGRFCLGKWPNNEYVIKVYKDVQIPDENSEFNIMNLTEDASEVVIVNGEPVFVTIDIPIT
ncbi:MAG: DUF4382 domain-containing protein [Thermosipho sp. (in: Bacteria)]|nr:DUF4382 domain-containing protein [Thermosipho sp. (in: thermotogales)]